MKKILLAWQFLSCLPPRPKARIRPGELSQAMAFFPLVGLGLALVPAIFVFISYQYFPPLPGSLVIIFIFTILTRGLHLDGLADTVDGFSGGGDRQEILAIMRDSRIGSMGVIALILIFAFKTALLNEIWIRGDKINLLKAIFLFPALSRWSMVNTARLLPYARSEGLGKIFAQKVTIREWLISTFFVVFLAIFMLKLYVVIFLPLVYLTSLFFTKYFGRRLGGVTGDVFGAINELMEVASLGYIALLSYRL